MMYIMFAMFPSFTDLEILSVPAIRFLYQVLTFHTHP